MLGQDRNQLYQFMETYSMHCEAIHVLPQPQEAEQQASAVRCPAWNERHEYPRQHEPNNDWRNTTVRALARLALDTR